MICKITNGFNIPESIFSAIYYSEQRIFLQNTLWALKWLEEPQPPPIPLSTSSTNSGTKFVGFV